VRVSFVLFFLFIIGSNHSALAARRGNVPPPPTAVHEAPPVVAATTVPAPRPEETLDGAFYAYDDMGKSPSSDLLNVKFRTSNPLRFDQMTAPFVKVKYVKLRESGKVIEEEVPLSATKDAFATFDLKKVSPTTVYRIDSIEVFDRKPCPEGESCPAKLIKKVGADIYLATDGPTKELQNRRRALYRALKEAVAWRNPSNVDWERRRQYGANGPDWCWTFYEYCTKPYSNVSVDVMGSFSARGSSYYTGEILRKTAGHSPVFGNLLKGFTDQNKSSNHVAMIIDVDPVTGKMWTVHGNRNGQVQIVDDDNVNTYKNFGHLSETMMR